MIVYQWKKVKLQTGAFWYIRPARCLCCPLFWFQGSEQCVEKINTCCCSDSSIFLKPPLFLVVIWSSIRVQWERLFLQISHWKIKSCFLPTNLHQKKCCNACRVIFSFIIYFLEVFLPHLCQVHLFFGWYVTLLSFNWYFLLFIGRAEFTWILHSLHLCVLSWVDNFSCRQCSLAWLVFSWK